MSFAAHEGDRSGPASAPGRMRDKVDARSTQPGEHLRPSVTDMRSMVGERAQEAAADVPPEAGDGRALTDAGSPSSDDGRRTGSARAVELAELGSLAVDVERRDDVVIVWARGELDVATVHTLRAELDGIVDVRRLVLDLRALSFIASTGLHLLVRLHHRAQRDGFELALLAPLAPVDRGIRLAGLHQKLPFEATADEADRDPRESPSGPRGGG